MKILAYYVLHIRSNTTKTHILLYIYFKATSSESITPHDITITVRNTITFLGLSLDFLPSDVTPWALQAAYTNTSLSFNINTNIIQLLRQ